MSIEAQAAKAVAFQQMHQGSNILVLPNAWDAASARVMEQTGFPAIATTSSGVAAALGFPDGEWMSRDMMIAAVARIAQAVTCPVSADMEAGYGDNIAAVLDTVEAVIGAGAVGINLEDSRRLPTRHLVDVAAQVELIQAVRDLANKQGVSLVINARTDLYLMGTDSPEARFAETVRRANAYHDAGADCLFVIGVSDAPTIAALARDIHGPINILAGPKSPPIAELARLGVARVTFGGGMMRAALGQLRLVAREVMDQGTYTGLSGEALPSADFQHLFG
jgi:2-methylisocitrate lyase-like PEP mutase family enzyme